MDPYPSIQIFEGFTQTPRDGRQVDNTADGLSRIRVLHADRFDFSVPHDVLTAADLATLRAFYTAKRLLSFEFTSPEDGTTYVVAFAARPTYTLSNGDIRALVLLTQTG